MSPDDYDMYCRRLKFLREYAVSKVYGFGWSYKRFLDCDERALADPEVCADEFELIGKRFLVVKVTEYSQQLDTVEHECCSTLEECESDVEEHIFQEAGVDYSFTADVLDLNLGRLLPYEVVRKIDWKLENTDGDQTTPQGAAERPHGR